MNYSNPFTMPESISLYGYWLYDAGGDAANLYFNIFNPKDYPFEVDNDTFAGLCEPFNCLTTRCRNNRMDISRWTVQDNAFFVSLVYHVRKAAAKALDFPNKLFLPYDHHKSRRHMYYNNPRQDADGRKHLFFFNVAMMVISGNKSLHEAARFAGVDPRNILNWISIFLTWGIYPFLNEFQSPSESECRKIINSHIGYRNKVLFTCTANRIFTRNKFRNMLRRYHPLRLQHLSSTSP